MTNYTLQELEDTLEDWWYDYSDESTEKFCQWNSYKVEQDRKFFKKE